MTDVQLILNKGVPLSRVRGDVESIVNEELTSIRNISHALIEGSIPLF